MELVGKDSYLGFVLCSLHSYLCFTNKRTLSQNGHPTCPGHTVAMPRWIEDCLTPKSLASFTKSYCQNPMRSLLFFSLWIPCLSNLLPLMTSDIHFSILLAKSHPSIQMFPLVLSHYPTGVNSASYIARPCFRSESSFSANIAFFLSKTISSRDRLLG